MRIIPGLTTTDKTAIAPFLAELAASRTRTIALFPTCLDREERESLYRELSAIAGLHIPHVHLRSDMGSDEIGFLSKAFGSEVFNVHSRHSSHPYAADAGVFASRIYVENADAVPSLEEFEGFGGVCIDYAHWESARLTGEGDYSGFGLLAGSVKIGCCHISAVRPGIRSSWGGFDHHRFSDPAELDYVLAYRRFLPEHWASLELENGLREQLGAIERLGGLLLP